MDKVYLQTEIGWLEITGTESGIIAVQYVDQAGEPAVDPPSCLRQGLTELAEYFAGERRRFSVNLLPRGTEFQQSVWSRLQEIPYGGAITYRQLAAMVGRPRAVRAAGRANATNKLNILIPCHRVVGTDGSLTGYSGGLWRKEWLLAHEASLKE